MAKEPDTKTKIVISGARQHNLKDISVSIPRGVLAVITGVSGSGKSTLAFDTIYAEAQRRYVESLSAYARQFLEQLAKPDVDSISGLSPAIAIDQKSVGNNPRSTVGTLTEIYDYLRVLFARVGIPHCPSCGQEITAQAPQTIVEQIMALPDETRVELLAPVVRNMRGSHVKLLESLRHRGFVRVRVDGQTLMLEDPIKLTKDAEHSIEVIIDRLVIGQVESSRLTDSVELGLEIGEGLLIVVQHLPAPNEQLFSSRLNCPRCRISQPVFEPRHFSFNSPAGACPRCQGIGSVLEPEPELIIPDNTKSIKQGAVHPWSQRPRLDSVYRGVLKRLCEHYRIDATLPWKDLPTQFQQVVLYGSGEEKGRFSYAKRGRALNRQCVFEGVIANLTRRYFSGESERQREMLLPYMVEHCCVECGGARLKSEVLAVKVGGANIAQICALTIRRAKEFFSKLELSPMHAQMAAPLLNEIRSRLEFLDTMGLNYLTMSRSAGTLSGGEGQRIRLAAQIGVGLTGVIYVLDEPSIGLHQRDSERLIARLKDLQNLGNTVLVVEHDRQLIESAEFIVDMGLGAGENGGEVIAKGSLEDIKNSNQSVTGRYLRGELLLQGSARRDTKLNARLSLYQASTHNLKVVNVDFPIGCFCCVTGVSGSGKSSLINDTLLPAALKVIRGVAKSTSGNCQQVAGLEHFNRLIEINQSPIGRTPRSNPATYTSLFDVIRELFSSVPEARLRGYGPGRFSFNVKGGRCEACQGAGLVKVEMHLLADIYITCAQCGGSRYNSETLSIQYKGACIADVLDMSVDGALEFLKNIPRARQKLEALHSVGLGYLRLGQSATTLSGGEAQRVKLAAELSKRQTGQTLYVLDEPTTGLHAYDVDRLLKVLHELVDRGNTVIVIEHNVDVIKSADWIVDLGPEGGDLGGEVVYQGPLEGLARCENSWTARYAMRLEAER